MLRTILIVGTGGFIGSVLRYMTSVFFINHSITGFPWGTFVVNILGSLLIGIIYGLSEKGALLDAAGLERHVTQ